MSRFDDRRWVVLTDDEADDINFSQVLEDSASTLRWNNDRTKTFVNYEGSKPSFLSGKTALTHAQMLTELENDEWVTAFE